MVLLFAVLIIYFVFPFTKHVRTSHEICNLNSGKVTNGKHGLLNSINVVYFLCWLVFWLTVQHNTSVVRADVCAVACVIIIVFVSIMKYFRHKICTKQMREMKQVLKKCAKFIILRTCMFLHFTYFDLC